MKNANHKNCIPALEDEEFLKSYEARGVRLQLDYLKAEETMAGLGIRETIVVFGSARIREERVAVENLRRIKESEKSGGIMNAGKISAAERMVEFSRFYDDARRLGRMIGRSGEGPEDNRIVLMTGGGPGIMEAANRGAHDVGARSIGLNIQLPHEQFPNPYVSPELCFQFHYFAVRKLHFFMRARALVAYPGGFGTLDELFDILTLIQTQKTDPIPVVLVGKSFWESLVDFEYLVECSMIAGEDTELFRVVDRAEEAWNHIVSWHIEHNTPLCDLYSKSAVF